MMQSGAGKWTLLITPEKRESVSYGGIIRRIRTDGPLGHGAK